MKYRVIHTIQSTDTSNPPVEVPYYRGDDLAQAIAAMGQAAVQSDTRWVTNLSVRLDFIPEPAPEWDFEAAASLDDCIYWSRPEADCAGPRVGRRRDVSGDLIVCEHHINHPPTD